ncbi:glutathione S-transferase N-terminal domain-containing protein [Candidatus Ruthia endofausta]|uniref:Glutathione S-transferase N-terminal domain-containing protein n=1 Tax=Candidatus Ruthia endofausta TaxID=2738852 RepID=A0A6N0HPS7_9GAMM|nr:glutaredoxin domain-containing protein [Candidatus Ruthia endofausta]QKQ24333.1 glutathione S-transferase N-terminal domain-containing protein [Candidatus Ruthia endofausta]
MKFLLKGLRNGLGAIIAFISWLIPVSKIKRTSEQQQKADKKTVSIELYQFFACPFCIKIRRVIRRLNLNIVTRNTQTIGSEFRDEMQQETGKVQVPCLKITNGNEVQWMFESDEISAYLNKHFG